VVESESDATDFRGDLIQPSGSAHPPRSVWLVVLGLSD